MFRVFDRPEDAALLLMPSASAPVRLRKELQQRRVRRSSTRARP